MLYIYDCMLYIYDCMLCRIQSLAMEEGVASGHVWNKVTMVIVIPDGLWSASQFAYRNCTYEREREKSSLMFHSPFFRSSLIIPSCVQLFQFFPSFPFPLPSIRLSFPFPLQKERAKKKKKKRARVRREIETSSGRVS